MTNKNIVEFVDDLMEFIQNNSDIFSIVYKHNIRDKYINERYFFMEKFYLDVYCDKLFVDEYDISWDNDYKPIKFEKVFESMPKEIQNRFVYHLDLFLFDE